MIVSLIKSATGLQAQKLKQLKIPHLLGEEAVEVRGGSLRAKVRSVLGIKSGSNKAMRTSGLAPSAATAASVAEGKLRYFGSSQTQSSVLRNGNNVISP